MTLTDLVALFSVLFVLALLPTLSSLMVVARSVTSGIVHGTSTSLGVAAGDIFFILIALFGLSFLNQILGGYFVYIKYIGGVYLIFLGIVLLRFRLNGLDIDKISNSSLLSSFLAGFLITLADQKAVLFYLGLFPVFIDLSSISVFDTSAIIIIALISVGGAKLCYVIMAVRTKSFINSKIHKGINVMAGSVLVGLGSILIVNTLNN